MMQAPHATAASPLPGGYTGERVGLVLPTSLCSSSIAKMCADRLNDWLNDAKGPTYFSRFVALPHTEGCGSKGKTIRDNYDNILVGHLTHPLVASALILEHGCESEHNEEMKNKLTTRGVPLTRQKQVAEVSEKAATVVGEQKTEDAFGWASVQYDGGIQNVYAKAQKWFQQTTLSSLPKAMP